MGLPLTFKSAKQEQEWDSHPAVLDSRLKAIVTAAVVHAYSEWGWIMCATCFLRSVQEDMELEGSGVHVVGRAGDFRTLNVPKNQVEELTLWINSRWQYDQDRPHLTVAYSKPHGNAPHLHIQTHPHTKPRVA